jgi:hypothetical protein
MEESINTHTMGNRLFIVLLLSVLTATGKQVKAQSIEIPERANLIKVIGTKADLFNFVAQTLSLEGYPIIQAEEAAGIISTGEKSFIPGDIKLSVTVMDSTVYVRGSARLGSGSSSEISNQGMKGSPARKWWDEMNRVALLLGSDPSYEKR